MSKPVLSVLPLPYRLVRGHSVWISLSFAVFRADRTSTPATLCLSTVSGEAHCEPIIMAGRVVGFGVEFIPHSFVLELRLSSDDATVQIQKPQYPHIHVKDDIVSYTLDSDDPLVRTMPVTDENGNNWNNFQAFSDSKRDRFVGKVLSGFMKATREEPVAPSVPVASLPAVAPKEAMQRDSHVVSAPSEEMTQKDLNDVPHARLSLADAARRASERLDSLKIRFVDSMRVQLVEALERLGRDDTVRVEVEIRTLPWPADSDGKQRSAYQHLLHTLIEKEIPTHKGIDITVDLHKTTWRVTMVHLP